MTPDTFTCPECNGWGYQHDESGNGYACDSCMSNGVIEDEAGEAYGIYFDQTQEDYNRLYDLGVIDGTHAALYQKGIIALGELYESESRTMTIVDGPDLSGDTAYWAPYNAGRDAAYANTCRDEVIAIFQEVTA